MARLEIHKFGGTSVGDAARIAACAAILSAASRGTRLVAVASTLAGVTDLLVAATLAARLGNRDEVRA